MANPNDPRTGTAYLKQVSLTEQASLPYHAVRYDDPAMVALRSSGLLNTSGSIGFVTSGYTASYFGNKDPLTNGHTTVSNGSAVLINAEGRLTAAVSVDANAFNTFALKAGDKYYLPGMIAFNFGTALIPGREYWLQLAGNPALTPPTQPGEWAVKVGVALTSTDMLVVMDSQGQLN